MDIKRKIHTFIKRQELGKCPCCEQNVYDNQLFVEKETNVYHFSCYNEKVKEEK